MVRAAVSPAAGLAAAALEKVWERVDGGARTVVVVSPPGAGKSTLVTEIARRLVGTGERVPLVAQTNDQADDLTFAMARQLWASDGEGVEVGRLHGADWAPPGILPRGVVASPRIMVIDLGRPDDSTKFLFIGQHEQLPGDDAVIV